MYKISGNKWNKRICKWIASFLTITLLVNQSCFSVLAEEYENFEYIENVTDTVADEEIENSDISDDVEVDAGTDTDVDANTESDIDSNEESDIENDKSEITNPHSDEETHANEEEEIVDFIEFDTEDTISAASNGDTFIYGEFTYQIINDDIDNLQVEVMRHVDGRNVTGAIDIPSSVYNGTDEYKVVSIREQAFRGCSNLTNIILPDSMTNLGDATFYECINLKSITLPDNITSIGEHVFHDCNNLESITIPNSVTNIGNGAFDYCSSLKNITIPDRVTSIGWQAFMFCKSLESVTILGSVTSIGEYAFSNCSSLTSINIPDSITCIDKGTFSFCSSLTNIIIPDSVTNIGESAFGNCNNLTNINIPDNVTNIGESAFYSCSSFTNITIPDSVTSIGNSAFGNCINLTNITIPDSVTNIGEYAFSYCSSLTNITIPDSIAIIERGTFSQCSCLENITISDNVTSIEMAAFGSCSSLTNITIPNNVASIGKYAFSDCYNLISVKILNDNISIGERAFEYCSRINNFQIAITENITATPTIKDNCFLFCPADRSLTFLTEDGTTELSDSTTPTLAEAVKVYNAVDDGGINDGYWYGWKLPEVSSVTYYPVTINVNKDDSTWSGCTKKYALSPDNGVSFFKDLDNVPNGTYAIYDMADSADSAKFINTDFTIKVKDSSAETTVDYYTVTFYSDKTVFDEQIILRNTAISAPTSSPTKDGYAFSGWTVSEDGSTEFDFGKLITEKTNIFACWIKDAEEFFTITTSAGTGGSITPSGEVKVKSGDSQQFTITPKDGYRVSSILADDSEVLISGHSMYSDSDSSDSVIIDTESNTEYYVFDNVTDNHTLEAYFEVINADDNKDPDDPNGDDNKNPDDPNGDDNKNPDDPNGDDNNVPGGSNNNNTDDINIPDASGGDDTYGNDGHDTSIDGDTGSNNTSGGSIPAVVSDTIVANETDTITNNTTAPTSKDSEPKTGDTSHIETYATIAMIAGLSYLLLYFADGKNGMTEEEKKEIVSALVKWAKKGKRLRKYAALAVIFLVLVYYHSIGKRTSEEWKAVYEK